MKKSSVYDKFFKRIQKVLDRLVFYYTKLSWLVKDMNWRNMSLTGSLKLSQQKYRKTKCCFENRKK